MSFENGWFIEKTNNTTSTNNKSHRRSIALKNYSIEHSIIFDQQSLYHHIIVFDSELYGYVLVVDGIIQILTSTCHDSNADNNTNNDLSSILISSSSCYHDEMMMYVPILSHPNPNHICIIGDGYHCGQYYTMIQRLLLLYETTSTTTNSVIQHITLYEKDILLIHVLKLYFSGYYPKSSSSSPISSSSSLLLSIWDDPRLTIISDIEFFQKYYDDESLQSHQQQQQQQYEVPIISKSRASDRMLASMMNPSMNRKHYHHDDYDDEHNNNLSLLDVIFSSSNNSWNNDKQKESTELMRNQSINHDQFDVIFLLRDPYQQQQQSSLLLALTSSSKKSELQRQRESLVRMNLYQCLYHALCHHGIIVMMIIPSSIQTLSIHMECLFNVFYNNNNSNLNDASSDTNHNNTIEYAMLMGGSSLIHRSDPMFGWTLMLLARKIKQQNQQQHQSIDTCTCDITSICNTDSTSSIPSITTPSNPMTPERKTAISSTTTSHLTRTLVSCQYPVRTLPNDIQETLLWYSPRTHNSIFILPPCIEKIINKVMSSSISSSVPPTTPSTIASSSSDEDETIIEETPNLNQIESNVVTEENNKHNDVVLVAMMDSSDENINAANSIIPTADCSISAIHNLNQIETIIEAEEDDSKHDDFIFVPKVKNDLYDGDNDTAGSVAIPITDSSNDNKSSSVAEEKCNSSIRDLFANKANSIDDSNNDDNLDHHPIFASSFCDNKETTLSSTQFNNSTNTSNAVNTIAQDKPNYKDSYNHNDQDIADSPYHDDTNNSNNNHNCVPEACIPIFRQLVTSFLSFTKNSSFDHSANTSSSPWLTTGNDVITPPMSIPDKSAKKKDHGMTNTMISASSNQGWNIISNENNNDDSNNDDCHEEKKVDMNDRQFQCNDDDDGGDEDDIESN